MPATQSKDAVITQEASDVLALDLVALIQDGDDEAKSILTPLGKPSSSFGHLAYNPMR